MPGRMSTRSTPAAHWGYPVAQTTQYFLSDDIESGNDSSEVGNASESPSRAALRRPASILRRIKLHLHYSAGQNEVNSVNNYSSGD